MKTILAGAAYFVAIFSLGFVLGVLRVLILEPLAGELAAMLIELPFILAASWMLCAAITNRFDIPRSLPERFMMGATALTLLMAAEYFLARYGFGRPTSDQLRDAASVSGAIGLAGQIVFAMFPLIQIHARR